MFLQNEGEDFEAKSLVSLPMQSVFLAISLGPFHVHLHGLIFITTILPCFSLYIAIPSNYDNLLKTSLLSHAEPYRLYVQNLCGGTFLPSLHQLEPKTTSPVRLQTSRLGDY